MKKLIYILIILLNSCASLEEAGKVLRNEKVNTTDEFLVKKKQPLELPPNYNELPTPNSEKKRKDNDDQIKEILKAPKKQNNNKSSSVEDSIIESIRK